MDHKLLYAFRGWIGFIAFMDLGTAFRCYIEKRSFLGELMADEPVLARMVGMYSVLKALALIHCTLFIHYRPVISLGICALVLSLLLYSSEVFVFCSTTLSFYVIFHSVVNVLTLVGLVLLPRRFLEMAVAPGEDENTELLRHASAFKRRRPKKAT